MKTEGASPAHHPAPPTPIWHPWQLPQAVLTVAPFYSREAGAHTDEIPCPRSHQLINGLGGI